MKRSTARANPSSVFDDVTNVAARRISALALAMTMLVPLRSNIRTSFGMSPIVAMCSVGMASSVERTLTTSPLFAGGVRERQSVLAT